MATLRRKLGFLTLAEGRQHWGAKMKDGQMAFVLRFGILQFGIAAGIACTAITIFLHGLTVLQAILYFLFMTLVTGLTNGFLLWYLIRWRFDIK